MTPLAWLQAAVLALLPVFEDSVGWSVEGVEVQVMDHPSPRCLKADAYEWPLVRFYPPCESGYVTRPIAERMEGHHWLMVVAHELTHVAQFQRAGRPLACSPDLERIQRYMDYRAKTRGPDPEHDLEFYAIDRCVKDAMYGPGGWLVVILSEIGPWPGGG